MEFSRPDLCGPEEEKKMGMQGDFWDDLKGEILPPALAQAARADEMKVFKERRAYDLVERFRLPSGTRTVGT